MTLSEIDDGSCYICLSKQLCKVDHVNLHALLCTFRVLILKVALMKALKKELI